MRLTPLLLVPLLACGDYVDYDADPPAAVESVGADALDEETERAFADAEKLDHLAFEGLLARYVTASDDGHFTFVDYSAIEASPEAQLILSQYLASMDLVRPAQLASHEERLAYWINAYNAGIIFGVLNTWGGDPTYKVINGALIFFDTPGYRFGGDTLTLNQIEHVIIRGDFDRNAFNEADSALQARLRTLHAELWEGRMVDARIHVALNCASFGCPNLPARAPFAYRADTLEEQLHAAAVEFANNPEKGAGPGGVSQLFDWYEEDWVVHYGSPRAFLEAHRDSLDGVALDESIIYDWTLNALENR